MTMESEPGGPLSRTTEEAAGGHTGTPPVVPSHRLSDARKGVKDSTKHGPEKPDLHGDLADKLQTRRSALMPFGIPPGLPAADPFGATAPQEMAEAAPAEAGGTVELLTE